MFHGAWLICLLTTLASTPLAAPVVQNEDEATRRALAHPEVQRFQDVFDGKIYKVRNLKE